MVRLWSLDGAITVVIGTLLWLVMIQAAIWTPVSEPEASSLALSAAGMIMVMPSPFRPTVKLWSAGRAIMAAIGILLRLVMIQVAIWMRVSEPEARSLALSAAAMITAMPLVFRQVVKSSSAERAIMA